MLNWIEIELTICIKMDLALNNLQRLICHKTQPTNQPTNQSTNHITQSSRNGVSQSNGLVSHQEICWAGRSYPFAEM